MSPFQMMQMQRQARSGGGADAPAAGSGPRAGRARAPSKGAASSRREFAPVRSIMHSVRTAVLATELPAVDRNSMRKWAGRGVTTWRASCSPFGERANFSASGASPFEMRKVRHLLHRCEKSAGTELITRLTLTNRSHLAPAPGPLRSASARTRDRTTSWFWTLRLITSRRTLRTPR